MKSIPEYIYILMIIHHARRANYSSKCLEEIEPVADSKRLELITRPRFLRGPASGIGSFSTRSSFFPADRAPLPPPAGPTTPIPCSLRTERACDNLLGRSLRGPSPGPPSSSFSSSFHPFFSRSYSRVIYAGSG